MARLVWDDAGDHLYETGVRNCVLYVMGDDGEYDAGVAWNGITAITESPSGAEATPIYADDIKYLNLYSAEEFGATIEAYTYPDEFEECDGSVDLVPGASIGQQERKTFAICYRTVLGNDTDGEKHGFKIHIIYGCKASPSERSYQTINDSPEAITFSWELTTTPVNVAIDDVVYKPTSIVTIDSTAFPDESTGGMNSKLKALLDKLYGTDPATEGGTGTDPELQMPDDIYDLLS